MKTVAEEKLVRKLERLAQGVQVAVARIVWWDKVGGGSLPVIKKLARILAYETGHDASRKDIVAGLVKLGYRKKTAWNRIRAIASYRKEP